MPGDIPENAENDARRSGDDDIAVEREPGYR